MPSVPSTQQLQASQSQSRLHILFVWLTVGLCRQFLASEKPIIGEFKCDKNEHTLPMVPAGAKLHQMKLCLDQVPLPDSEFTS